MSEERIAKTSRSDIRFGLVQALLPLVLSLELMTGQLTYGRKSTVTMIVIWSITASLWLARGVRGRMILKTGSEKQKRRWVAILGPEEKPRKSTKWSRRITIGFCVVAVILGSWLFYYVFHFDAR